MNTNRHEVNDIFCSLATTNTHETCEVTSPGGSGLAEAECLVHELKKLLVKSESALDNGDAKNLVEQLERWAESYRRGISAAQKLSSDGPQMLQKARDLVNLALEEKLRLEDEGGNPPATRDQANDVDNLTCAVRRIDQLMPVIEQSVGITMPAPEEAPLKIA